MATGKKTVKFKARVLPVEDDLSNKPAYVVVGPHGADPRTRKRALDKVKELEGFDVQVTMEVLP